MSAAETSCACACRQSPHAGYCASPEAFAERTGAQTTFCVTSGHVTVAGPHLSTCRHRGAGVECGARILGARPARVLTALDCFCCGQPRESMQAGCAHCGMTLFQVHTFNRSWLTYRYSGELPDPDRFAC